MIKSGEILASGFGTLSDLVRANADERPDKTAIADAAGEIDYRTLNRHADAIAAALQREQVPQGAAVAVVAAPSVAYGTAFVGILRAGCVPAPLAPSASAAQLAAMIADCGALFVFLDAAAAAVLGDASLSTRRIALDGSDAGQPLAAFAPDGTPTLVAIAPDDPFNIIYSSGTTGTPKGIVQSHAMRWAQIVANSAAGFEDAVTMVATPLYSNTTLVSFIPTLAYGGTVVLAGAKFDPRRYLELSERHRATHAMLVPVQYQRLMADEDFDRFDLSSFRLKTCTSAPFSAALKADVLARWPGLLVEYYGLTEGGCTFVLNCSANPNKLHTVGQPARDSVARLIDDAGNEVAPGEPGEVVGRSAAMMNGYHGRADASRDAEWFDADGHRYLRHGDIGRFDADGFLILLDRKKDMIISGGFNIYPTDLEAALRRHPAVADCAVIGVPSKQWGETPVGCYVPHPGVDASVADILAATNADLGKTQRLSALHAVAELPRSAIGKVLKRELRDRLVELAA